MTLNDFINDLDQFGEDIQVGSNSFWEQAIEKVSEDLQAMNLTSKRSNIDWGVDGDDVFLEIEDYLIFQNYGVKAKPESTTAYNLNQDPVEGGWGLAPSGGSNFQFGTGGNGWGASYSGLNAKADFSLNGGAYNITNEFTNYFEQIRETQSNL